ncbi:Membrane protein involved in the export of O-antigen and teichoic acid [Nocardioides terrae]|uniref:Membrane protein involved in the export of O-antigen and teichoic acid n=1 Tax=Nocardioides terrae TaxID=574651 RepID=A0A1I1ERZ1_9ACTN|nr:oligosaccharide flippase family protein [Nocardioides terrae]SFB87673.1 Membrane protein involved in the export of O-antigen and teichoic acid [Nocardioides terrae]
MSARRAVLTTTIGNFVPPLISLVCAPMLARGLGIDGRGAVAAAQAPLILAAGLLAIGLPDALTYYIAQHRVISAAVAKSSASAIVLVGAVGMVAIIALSTPMSHRTPSIAHLITIGSLPLIPTLWQLLVRGVAAGMGEWNRLAADNLIGGIAKLVAIVVALSIDALSPLVATVIVTTSSLVGLLAYLPGKPLARGLRNDDEGPKSKEVLSYGTRVWSGSITGVLLIYLDQVLMTPLSSSTELGIYAVAVSISQVPLVFNAAVRSVTFARESTAPNLQRMAQSARISTAITAAAAGAVWLVSAQLVPLLFGHAFARSVDCIGILVVAVVAGSPGVIAGAGLGALGRPGLRSAALAIACVANAVAIILLVPPFGAIGAAWATVIGNGLAAFVTIFWMRKAFGQPALEYLGFTRADLSRLADLARVRARPETAEAS